MRHLLAIPACLLLAAAAHAQVDEAARQKLQAMADAARQMQSLTYSVVYKGEGGMFSSMLPETRADVAMLKDAAAQGGGAGGQTGNWKLRITGTKAPLANMPALDFVVVVDGNIRKWQDDAAKIVYERPAHSARSEHLDTALLAALRELYQSNPFEKDLAAETIKLEPSSVVNGIPVDVVLVDPGHNQPMWRYSISIADRMPRRVEQVIGDLGSIVWTINNLTVNAPVGESAFKVDVPEGYTHSPMVSPQQAVQPTQVRPAVPAVKQRTVGVEVDDLAPEFVLSTSDGNQVSLSSLKGDVAVLAFWGSWSAPSKRAISALQPLHQKFEKDGVKFLALSFREGNEQNPVKHFAAEKLTYPLLVKADEIAKTYKVKVPPTFFVIGRAGEIVYTASGYNQDTIPTLEQKIVAALNPAKPAPGAAGGAEDAAGETPRPPASQDGDAAGDGGR